MRKRIVCVLLVLCLCQSMLLAGYPASAGYGEAQSGQDLWALQFEDQLRAIENQYNSGIMLLGFTIGNIPWKYFGVTGLPNGVTEDDWKAACNQNGYLVDNTGVMASKFPTYSGIHFASVTVNNVPVVRAGILKSDTTGEVAYYYLTIRHQTGSNGTPEVSATLLRTELNEKFVVNYVIDEYVLTYDVKLNGQIVTDEACNITYKDSEGNEHETLWKTTKDEAGNDIPLTWKQAVFGGTQPDSTTNAAASFDVTIPYGYTAHVYREYEDGTARVDLTSKNVDEEHRVNDGFPLGTEPVYTSTTSKNLNIGPSAMRVNATFYSDHITENRRIVVELEKRTSDPIFDAHHWLATDNASGRGSTGQAGEDGELIENTKYEKGNLLPDGGEDAFDWGVMTKDPHNQSNWSSTDKAQYGTHWWREDDGTYSLRWIFQTNSAGNSYLLNSLEMNGMTIALPYTPEQIWEGGGAGKGASGTYAETALPDGAVVHVRFVRQFGNTQRIYAITITGARTDITVTGGNLFMLAQGAPEYVARPLTGVYASDISKEEFGYFGQDGNWHTHPMSLVQVQDAKSANSNKTDFTSGDSNAHYGANIRFKLQEGYELPVYSWIQRMSDTVLEGNADQDGKQKKGSVIGWEAAAANLEGGKLKTNCIYGPDEDGWYYIRLEHAPGYGDDTTKMLTLSITATAMKYMVRYMAGEYKGEGDLANTPKGGAQVVANMPTFSTDDSTWDDDFDFTWDGRGDYIDRYDDNFGNFYDVQNYPTIAVSDLVPIDETLAPDTKTFRHWVVVDQDENVYCQKGAGEPRADGNGGFVDDNGRMVDGEGYLLEYYKKGTGEPRADGNGGWIDEDGKPVNQDGYLLDATRRIPYTVDPNKGIQLKDYNDFAISLDQELGGTDNNYYVIRLKAAWADTPASFEYHVRMVYEDETGRTHVLNFLQDVRTEWDESRINEDGTLTIGVSPTDDIFVDWLNANPEYTFDEERNSTPTAAGEWEPYPEIDPNDPNNSIKVECKYRIIEDNTFAVQNGATILIYMIRRNGYIPVAKKIVGSPRGADTFTYTITAKLRPEDIARLTSSDPNMRITEDQLKRMLPVGTYYGWPDLDTDTSVGIEDGYEQPGAPAVMQFARVATGNPETWESTATFTLEGGQAVTLYVPQAVYTITEMNPGVYHVFIDGGTTNVADHPTVERTVITGKTSRSVLFENHVRTMTVDSVPEMTKEIVDLKGARVTDQDATFTFELKPVTDYGSKIALPSSLTRKIETKDGVGEATFGGVTFNYAGTYQFLVMETGYDSAKYLPAPDSHSWVVTVENNGGQLQIAKVTVDGAVYTANGTKGVDSLDDAIIKFTNRYIVATPGAVSVVPEVRKVLNGRHLAAGEFSFSLDYNGTIMKAVNSAAGTVRFDPIEFDKEGKYTVTVREEDGKAAGIDYDKNTITITYDIKDDGNGKLYLAETVYDNGIDTFTNDAYVEVEIPVKKLYDVSMRSGQSWGTDVFHVTAELFSADGNVEFRAGGIGDVYTSFKVGEARSRDLDNGAQETTFYFRLYGEGEYVFIVEETLGNIPGVSYDGSIYLVTVTVTANGAQLTSAKRITQDGTPVNEIVFQNYYDSNQVSIPLKARKILEGGTMTAHQFRFEMRGPKANSDEYVVVSSGYNDAVGNVVFTQMFRSEGTYQYYLREDPGTDDRILYDRKEYQVTIRVDRKNGGLVATVLYDGKEDTPVFINRMQDPGQLIVTNTVIGGTDPTREFTYRFDFTDQNGRPVTGQTFRYQLGEMVRADGIMPLYAPESSELRDKIRSGQSVSLRHGQQVTIYLPSGTEYRYTITESGYEPDYFVSYSDAAGSHNGAVAAGALSGTGTTRVDFLNRQGVPDVNITKTQAVNGAIPTEDVLTVKAGDEVTYYLTLQNDGDAAANNVTVTDVIPAGLLLGTIQDGVVDGSGRILWNVSELAANGGTATVSFTVTVPEGNEAAAWKNKATATYLAGVTSVTKSSKEVVLQRFANVTGSLTVSKQVKGKAGDLKAEFGFTVLLSDTSVSGTYGDMEFDKGIAFFTLKHGESKTASGLPEGMHYSVREQSANQDGYVTIATGTAGTIAADTTVTAIFVNARDAVDVPQTGDHSHLALWMLLAVISLMGIAVFGRKAGTQRKHTK